MPIYTKWRDDEKTIIHRTYEDAWTWEEEIATEGDVTALLDAVAHRVDMILDASRATHFPVGFGSQLPRADSAPYFTHRNAGRMFVVGATPAIRIIIEALQYARPELRKRIKLADTYEDALTLIASARAADDQAD